MPKPTAKSELDDAVSAAVEVIESGEYDGPDLETPLEVEAPPAAAATPRQPSGENKDGGARGGAPGNDAPEHQHPRRLVALAKDYDFSDDEIAALSTEALEVALHKVIRLERAQLQRDAQVSRASEANTDRQRQRSQEPEPEEEIDWGEVEEGGVKRKIKEDEVHEAVVHVIKNLNKKVKGLEEKLGQKDKSEAASAQEKFEAEFDAACSEFESILGTGTGQELKNTKFFKRRLAVYPQVAQAVQANPKANIKALVQEAVKELYDYQPETPPEAPKGKPPKSAYTQGKLARPTGRKGELPRSPEKARAAVDQWFEEHGGEEEDDDPDSEY